MNKLFESVLKETMQEEEDFFYDDDEFSGLSDWNDDGRQEGNDCLPDGDDEVIGRILRMVNLDSSWAPEIQEVIDNVRKGDDPKEQANEIIIASDFDAKHSIGETMDMKNDLKKLLKDLYGRE